MLQSVHVKNLALIEEIEVDFKDGLNILTGETGAGKSIILGSVGLALGGRYTKDIIRQGADYGLVELIFLVGDECTRERLEALDIFPEDGAVVLSRRLMEKRSVSRINGETVTMALLKEAASALIDIHGQHEHQSLLYKKNHLEIVDAFAGESAKAYRSCVKDDYDSYRKYKKELEAAQLDTAQRAKEISFLEFEISEITGAGLLPGEDEELESLYRRMVNGKQIAESSAQAYAYTSEGDGSASENLSRAIRSLSEIAEYDESAGALCGQLEEIDALLNDFNRELSDYSKSCEFSEEEFYETENRLNEINRLKAKYGSTVEEILDYCKENGITFYAYMVLEQGALSGKYDTAHPFPEGSDRAKCYGPVLPQLGKLIEKMRQIGGKYDASPAQIAAAWAIAKGTLPIIGVTKVEQVEAAAKAAEIALTADEISELEALGDTANINTLREWEKEM